MADRSKTKVVSDSDVPPRDDIRNELIEVDNLCHFNLNESFKNSPVCDVLIKVKLNGFERTFKCNKGVLAAASPYFEAMFRGRFKESYSDEVTINDVDPNVFSVLFDYLHTKDIQINEENIVRLMIADSMFQINGLEKLCSNFLESQIDIYNCFEFAMFVEYYGYMELSTKFEKFIGKNFIAISKTQIFKLQPDSVISKVITQNELHVVCESQVFNALLEWIKYDLTSRQNCLKQLIKKVRCHLIKPTFISMQLENCDVIRNTCYEHLSKVLEDLKAYIPIESKPRQLDIPQVIYVITEPDSSTEKVLKSAEFRLSETDVRFKLPNLCLKNALFYSKSAVINGFIYVLINLSGNGDMERYDPITNEWKQCKSLGERLSYDRVEVIDNELYLIIIADHGINLMKYDPITDEWTQRASLNDCRLVDDCTVFNRMLYAFGNNDITDSVPFFKKYDPQKDEWSTVNPTLTPRYGSELVTLGNYIYVIGGWDDEKYLKTVERYDVLNDNWEFVASMNHWRACPKAVVFNKKIYIFGDLLYGPDEDGRDKQIVECYDQVTNEWKVVASSNENIDHVVVSYQPCVPDICVNFPF